LNPKFFRNGIVMLVLVVGTAALLFTWIQSTAPSTPIGLRWVAALQAGLVLLIVALAWPLVTSLLQSLHLPSLWFPTTSTIEAWLAEAYALTAALATSLQALPGSAAAWLRLAPNWIAVWPAVVAGGALAAVVGNSILLSGNAPRSHAARARRL